MSKKASLRRALIAARQAVSADVRAEWDADIAGRVHAWWLANPVRILGVYWPIQDEPDLRSMYAELSRKGVALALPVVTDKDAPLEFAAWSPGDALIKDAHGVPVPAETRIFMRPEALLVPCVGFNAQRFRLGYGAGYYDRTLAALPRPLTVGIAYTCALAAFDAAPHDIALDTIITETA
ncbi:MAG: 5-formyltetrahydrofolate cyclo-ligase [Pseudomonadota bacterium]